MRILKWLLGILVLLVLVFVIGGMLLPREVEVARSIEIEAPAAEIYPHIADLKKNIAWSPWQQYDPNVKNSFSGSEMGAGAVMEWASENRQVGSGRMEITDARENEHLTVALDFGDMGTANATWDLVEVDGKTTATWGMIADMGAGPIGRWMGLKMDDWVGADYDRGLQNLKTLIEGS